jgi:hypothetical protein
LDICFSEKKKTSSHSSLVICFFPTLLPIKTKTWDLQEMSGGGTLLGNSNPPGPIKLCSCQSTAGVIVWLCCAIHQSQQTMQKFWAKTMLLNQTGMF